MNRLEPLRFRPSLRDKVWGTREHEQLIGPSGNPLGEAWCLHDGSEVAEGPLRGRSVASLVSEFGPRLMGRPRGPARSGMPKVNAPAKSGAFPLIGKLIFADGRLSVQVHPDDEWAQRVEQAQGKTELWYVAGAKPGGELGLGLTEALAPDQLASAARDGSIEGLLRWVPARAGQCVLVPAGTVHSARNGVVLCEIQQNSDITYRLYDYGQNGLDGRPRALQVERGIQAADTASRPELADPTNLRESPCRTEELGRCRHFVAELMTWDRPFLYTPDPHRCQMVIIVGGMGSMNATSFASGDAFLIPAESARFPVDGDRAVAVRAYLP